MKFLLLLILLTQVSFGSDKSEDLSLELKVKTALYQSSIQSQLYLIGKVKPLLLNSLNNASYSDKQVSEDVDRLLNEVMTTDDYVRSRTARSVIKSFIVGIVLEVREIARKEGIAIAILASAGEILELLSPVLMTGLGVPQLIVPAELILAPEINVPVTLALKKGVQRFKLMRLYGGQDNFRKIMQLRMELKSDFGLDENNVMYEDEGINYFSVSSKFSFFGKIRTLFRMRKVLNPLSLKRALKIAGFWNEDLQRIKKSDLDSSLRSILMIAYTMKNFSNGHEVLVERFPTLHFEKKDAVMNYAVYEWAMKFSEVENHEELAEWVNKIPKTSSALEIMLLWRNIFLPHIIEESIEGIGFTTYRSWSKGLDKIFATAELNPNENWNEEWSNRFDTYLGIE